MEASNAEFDIFSPMIDELAQTYAHYVALRREFSLWVEQSMRRDGPDKNHGGEDEANFALAFFPHYLVSGDERTAVRFRSLANDLKAWVSTECLHGYEAEAEAHHGTEPFLLFLPRYLGLFPDDREAAALLDDAAHHIGNWIEGVPAWYDWTRDIFLSYWIGTRTVGGAHGDRELAEHFRFLHIALAAWRVTGEARYRDWALRYGRKRAERLLATDGRMPVLWDLDGRGLQPEDLRTRAERGMAANNHHIDDDPLAGVENLLASGAVYALGDLFLLEGDDIFRRAAKRIVEPLIGELLDPYADPAAAALSYYRWTFADSSLDDAMCAVLARQPVEPETPWAMVFPPGAEASRAGGGQTQRHDLLGPLGGRWLGAALARAEHRSIDARISIDRRADHGPAGAGGSGGQIRNGRRVLRGGREHADMGGAICSVAAGHGRNWGCGAVTGCYGPLLMGTREVQGAVVPLVEWAEDHLPEQILALLQPPVSGPGTALFYNGGEVRQALEWRMAGAADWQRVELAPGEVREYPLEEYSCACTPTC